MAEFAKKILKNLPKRLSALRLPLKRQAHLPTLKWLRMRASYTQSIPLSLKTPQKQSTELHILKAKERIKQSCDRFPTRNPTTRQLYDS